MMIGKGKSLDSSQFHSPAARTVRFSAITSGATPLAARLAACQTRFPTKTTPAGPAPADPMPQALIAAPALAFAASALGVWILRATGHALPRDVPNARSLHGTPVPRAGGYAIWLGFVPAALLFAPAFPGGWAGWLPAWLALAVVSGRDDVREVGVAARLAVHALAASWAAAALVQALPAAGGNDWPRTVLTAGGIALAIAWSANLYNFMDGVDGLAGTMAAVGFAAYGIAALAADAAHAHGAAASSGPAPAFLALAAAILPFLAVNLPRATMFLGDVGAVPLGFLAAAFGAAGVVQGLWPAWFPILVFLPFIADATLTLARRTYRRDRLWEGHRDHYYQRLARTGAGHGGTLALYAALMAGTAATALACRSRLPAAGWWALAAWCAALVMLFAAIDYHWRKKTNTPSPR
jgi:UDP-N-acetylmuramyl pentapeptide phosphotransferase/UDP-N-acetylglucosamine-1-phosphate transferase